MQLSANYFVGKIYEKRAITKHEDTMQSDTNALWRNNVIKNILNNCS
jgi:hypothetical protein